MASLPFQKGDKNILARGNREKWQQQVFMEIDKRKNIDIPTLKNGDKLKIYRCMAWFPGQGVFCP